MVEVHKAFERFQIMIEEFASSVPPLGRGLCGQRAAVMFKIELPHPSSSRFLPAYVLLKPVKINRGRIGTPPLGSLQCPYASACLALACHASGLRRHLRAKGKKHIAVEILLLIALPAADHLRWIQIPIIGGDPSFSSLTVSMVEIKCVSTSLPSMPRQRKVS